MRLMASKLDLQFACFRWSNSVSVSLNLDQQIDLTPPIDSSIHGPLFFICGKFVRQNKPRALVELFNCSTIAKRSVLGHSEYREIRPLVIGEIKPSYGNSWRTSKIEAFGQLFGVRLSIDGFKANETFQTHKKDRARRRCSRFDGRGKNAKILKDLKTFRVSKWRD